MGLIGSELLKLTSVKTTYVLTLAGIAFAMIGAGFFVFESEFSGEFVGTDAQVAATIDQVGAASPLVLVVALLLITTEFRHGTIGRALQLNPSRTALLVGKAGIAVAYAVVFFLLGLVAVGLMMLLSGESLAFGALTGEALWQGPVGLALTAVLGVTLGALIRSQVVAVSLTLVWVFLGETLVNQFAPEVGRWLPFQALNSLFVSEELMAGMPEGMVAPLEPLVGLSVFVGYLLVTAVAAIALMRYRDV
jgi:ABC-2 type transport system permease protein